LYTLYLFGGSYPSSQDPVAYGEGGLLKKYNKGKYKYAGDTKDGKMHGKRKIIFKVELFMKDIFRMAKSMEKEKSFIIVETFMKDK
jgi:hypothetical protein